MKTMDVEVPILPPFSTEAFDISVTLEDQSIEIIKVMAKGRAAAIQTAVYTISRWPNDKVVQILSLTVTRV